MAQRDIDINCDLGEGYGIYESGDDVAMMDIVSSINVAAGFHAGDPSVISKTIDLATKKSVSIGVHPGFNDREGFGRRTMGVSPEEVYDLVLYQIGAVHAFVYAQGSQLTHVKPHGALYNQSAKDRPLADAIAQAVHDFDWNLVLVGLAGSQSIHASQAIGLKTASEIFLDRNYETDGSLTPRTHPDAMIIDHRAAAKRICDWLSSGELASRTGNQIAIKAETICVHGDSKDAVAMASTLRDSIVKIGYEMKGMKRRDQERDRK